jgi:hypothetical protein
LSDDPETTTNRFLGQVQYYIKFKAFFANTAPLNFEKKNHLEIIQHHFIDFPCVDKSLAAIGRPINQQTEIRTSDNHSLSSPET